MPVYLSAVAAEFYRGIGPKKQVIGPLGDMNFFVGANNAGKSIVLNLIKDQLPKPYPAQRSGDTRPRLKEHERYQGLKMGQFFCEIGVLQEDLKRLAKEQLGELKNTRPDILKMARQVLDNLSDDGIVWIELKGGNWSPSWLRGHEPREAEGWIDHHSWNTVWHALTGKSGGGLGHHWIPDTIRHLALLATPELPDAMLIPAKRLLGPKGEAFQDLSGAGLIDHLATLQNPDFNMQEDRARFEKINLFLRDVTGKPDALLEVPSSRQHLLVHMDDKVLPLEALGTGIHETILLAAFCTIHQNVLMCIEEPEIHLHPVLQRKLISYLKEKTENQYFIATHSASFLDSSFGSVFRVENDGIQTNIGLVISDHDRRGIIDELGYRASDILQTNCVIWVEGPSDRIYLRCWISTLAPEFKEGEHYTIPFYGGALLRHLSASEDTIDEFIMVLRLSPNCAIVMDSDKENADCKLKPNVERVARELQSVGRIAWITEGREIENYLNFAAYQETLKSIHPKIYDGPYRKGKYEHAFFFYRTNEATGRRVLFKDADKVGAAIKHCQYPADLDSLDLRDQVSEIVNMIRTSNY